MVDSVDQVIAKWVCKCGPAFRKGVPGSKMISEMLSDSDFDAVAYEIPDRLTGGDQISAAIRAAAKRCIRRCSRSIPDNPNYGRF